MHVCFSNIPYIMNLTFESIRILEEQIEEHIVATTKKFLFFFCDEIQQIT